MNAVLDKHLVEIKQLCKSLKVNKLYVFGSVLTSRFNKDSDIDFLLSFVDSLSIEEYTKNYFSLHYKLREILHREVDIITEKTLKNPYLIDAIDESKRLIYAA